jgi:hypothetical protein
MLPAILRDNGDPVAQWVSSDAGILFRSTGPSQIVHFTAPLNVGDYSQVKLLPTAILSLKYIVLILYPRIASVWRSYEHART